MQVKHVQSPLDQLVKILTPQHVWKDKLNTGKVSFFFPR